MSVVVPVLDEEGCVEELARRVLSAVTEQASARLELIFVDDGSSDGTASLIRALHRRSPNIMGIHLTRSFGHQAAIRAGLSCATGDAVITMDGDLQHPPESIPELVRCWREGADVVHTVRRDASRKSSWMKSVSAKLYYSLFDRLSAVRTVHGGADFRLLDRRVVNELNRMDERFLFLRGLIPWMGFPSRVVEYELAPRFAGRVKYHPRKMLRLAADGVFSFSVVPLRIIGLVGLAATALGMFYGLFAIASFLVTDRVVSGWTSLVVLVLVFGGIQLLALGIASEYLGRIYEEVKRRPSFIVGETTGSLGPSRSESSRALHHGG